ncbi:hypothetical protein ACH5RR_039951 [Cinchona calisaya]|uniref:Pectinesterase inhibitor domain-containing protein n=1 Tax=Cinchona calisaya TaxID=153742 RepID=A0ABD2Y106_9GENT
MADIKICFLLVIFVTLFSFGHPQFSDYHQICQKTTDSVLCIRIIDASGTARFKTNANGWLQILNDQVKTLAITTNTKIGDALRSNPSPRAKQSLDLCNDEYNSVVATLDNLEWFNLNKSNYPDFNRRLAQLLFIVEDCISSFTKPPPTPTPIGVFNENVKHVIQLTLQVLNLNQCNKITACT